MNRKFHKTRTTKQISTLEFASVNSFKSDKQIIEEAEEAQKVYWPMSNAVCSLSNIVSNYCESMIRVIKPYQKKNQHVQDINRALKNVGGALNMLVYALQPTFKDKTLQTGTVGNLQIILDDVLAHIIGITCDGEFLTDEEYKKDVALIPDSLEGVINSTPVMKDQIHFYGDDIRLMIKDANDYMDRHGIDKGDVNATYIVNGKEVTTTYGSNNE